MKFNKTDLKDAYFIEIEKLQDRRGYFARTYCKHEFEDHNLTFSVVQANVSYNKRKGTLRGMHYRAQPYGEAKLVGCSKGAIFDAIIDVRRGSPTFKQWMGMELNEHNHRMLYVPEGFAHGFITLENETEVTYLMSEFYTPKGEKGISFDDPAFDIAWPVEVEVISEKDRQWPLFE